MIAHVSQVQPAEIDWNQVFEGMLPTIVAALRFEFRKLECERREDAIHEGVANCFVAFHRLVGQGRSNLVYPTVLARYAAAHFRAGRTVGGRMNANDVTSRYAQLRRGIRLQSLDQYDEVKQEWREAVINDPKTPVFQQVWFRIDFPAWLKTLRRRDRQVALALVRGHATQWVARKFELSPARISQLRRELYDSWLRFHAEPAKNRDLPAA